MGVESSLEAAQIRFVQVSQGAPEMDFYVNGTGAAYGLGFASFTSYLPVSSGAANLGVTKAGSGQALVGAQSGFSGGHQYTAVLSHGLGNLREIVYADQDTPAPQGQIALRVLNEVEAVDAVSVHLAPFGSGTNVALPTPVFGLAAGAGSGYFNVPSNGGYTVTATIANGVLNVPIASVNMKASSGAVRTVIFAGAVQPGGHGVVAFTLEDGNAP